MQIFACEAIAGGGPELGHLASARNLAKLNVISPAVFPLPPAMAMPFSEDIYIPDEPDSPGGSITGAEDTMDEVTGSKHLLQVRMQSSIYAGMSFALSYAAHAMQRAPTCADAECEQRCCTCLTSVPWLLVKCQNRT